MYCVALGIPVWRVVLEVPIVVVPKVAVDGELGVGVGVGETVGEGVGVGVGVEVGEGEELALVV